ncbi:MAG: methyltransferase domain-containing protein [Planctomycetaceae bacterium]|nr:methyltransferase domain-containing protein [Planctomycetaceae bacterium]
MKRRIGDTTVIGGDYQHRALTHGPAVQRFWHYSKQLAVAKLLPPASGEFVLDVGCGSGVISHFLANQGPAVLGIDANEAAIEFARSHGQGDGARFLCGLVDEAFALERPADKIYCLEVIEHLYAGQGRQMLDVFAGLLAPGGQVLLTTPNYASAWPAIERTMDLLHLAPPMREHQHVTHYTPRRLRKLCTAAGFKVERLMTHCFIAPWAAALSWRLAERLAAAEFRYDLRLGSILVAVLRK